MRSCLAVLSTLAAAGGCVATEEPTHFAEARAYGRLAAGFATPEACESYREQDPIFNCNETLELCPTGDAMLLITDILNLGQYELGDGIVIAEFGPGDVPPRIELAIEGDELVTETLGARPFVLDPVRANAWFCDPVE